MLKSTLVLIKYDGIVGGNVGAIISRFERLGFSIIAMRMETATKETWEAHYSPHEGKEFYESLIERMTNTGPVIALALTGDGVVPKVRNMAGPASADMALPGTIRGDFGTSLHNNVVHTSENEMEAERELTIWF